MAAIDNVVASHWPRDDRHLTVTPYLAMIAIGEVDVIAAQVADLLGVIIDTASDNANGEPSRQQVETITSLTRAAVALLGQIGPSIDQVERYSCSLFQQSEAEADAA